MKPTTPSRSALTGANPHTRATRSTRPGLTIREVLAATAVTGAALCLALPLLAQVRSDDRQQRDAVQLRGLLDAFTIWAGNNKEAFPLPSQLDVNNATINLGTPGDTSLRFKDDTGNIVSVLTWNGLVRPEAVVSPAGTTRVFDLFPGPVGSSPRNMTDVRGTLFFYADDGIVGDELFSLAVGTASCNLADVTGPGGPPAGPDGQITGDDFVAFIAAFAEGRPGLADVTGIGGEPAIPDGLITGDDFIAFISAFATGCP